MNLIKWILVFSLSFMISLFVFMTFSQDVFKQTVPGKFFGYSSQPIALYWFVIGAFSLGLLIGILGALYAYITQISKIVSKNKQIKELEHQLVQKEQEVHTSQEPQSNPANTEPE